MKFIDNVKKRMIVLIDDKVNYAQRISKVLNVTYAPVSKYVIELVEEGILMEVRQPSKRKKVIKLTEKGEQIKKLLIKLQKLEN